VEFPPLSAEEVCEAHIALKQKGHITRDIVIMPTLLAAACHSHCDVCLALRFLRIAISNQDRVSL